MSNRDKFISREEVAKICPDCAEKMESKGFTHILRSTFEDIAGPLDSPKVKDKKESKKKKPKKGCGCRKKK